MSSVAIAYAFILPASASLSCMASSTILYKIATSPTKMKSPYTRFLSGLSVYDILYSLSFLASSLASPKGTSWGAVGNTTTCNIQGFFLLFGQFGTTFYNFGLCIYYLYVIKYSTSDERFSASIEPYLHVIPAVYGLFIASFSVSTGNINPAGMNQETFHCYLSPLPLNCVHDPDTECIRGEHAPFLQMILIIFPMLLNGFGLFTAMGMICSTVREQENRMEQYVFRLRDGQTPSRRSVNSNGPNRNRKVRNQALSYAVVVVVCYLPAALIMFTSSPVFFDAESELSVEPVIIILTALLTPLQGLLNVFIFLRPQVCNIRDEHGEKSWRECFIIALKTVDIADNRERSRRLRRSSRHEDIIGRIGSKRGIRR